MLCDDLIFFSRVAGTARAQGFTVQQSRSPSALLEAAKSNPPAAVILDLQHEGLDLPQLLADLRQVVSVMPRTVAFGSHVEAETLQAARQAGCDLVMPRSQFAKMLEDSLKEWLVR
jgi:DNA-binding NarL/FixJ family response regulator